MWHGIFPKAGTTRVTDPDGYEVKSHTTYVPTDTTVHTTGQFKAYRREDNPASYGHEFNLLRAVKEHGPIRVAEINKRVDDIEKEMVRLLEERDMLQRLIDVVK